MSVTCWHSHRPQHLTPRQAVAGYSLAAALALPGGVVAWWFGFTPVAAFVLVELVALAAALVAQARHACDAESLRLEAGELQVERRTGPITQRDTLPRAWLRIEDPARADALVGRCSGGRRIEVGRHLPIAQRWQLAAELRAALARR